jgi:hypothetical protein
MFWYTGIACCPHLDGSIIVSLSICPQDGGSKSCNMLTTIYPSAGHHIPEALYLHGTFTTVLDQLPTDTYILFACRHTLTNNTKSLKTKLFNKCNIQACKKYLWCSSISTLAPVINHHIRSGELKLYKFLILVLAPASVTPGQRLVVYTSPITSGRRPEKPQGISTWDGNRLASIPRS